VADFSVMPKMLPALPQAFGNLKDVFRSAADSIAGRKNALGLNPVKNALVIMVDGLGWHNLNDHLGHAPFLRRYVQKSSKGYCGFPSTTAASIVSFATGVTPSQHGFIGYRIFDRAKNQSVNLLTGLDESSVDAYIHVESEFAKHQQAIVISRSEYEHSGFSAATFPGAKFIGENSLDARFAKAIDELNSGSGKLIYLYVPELDQTAHRFGSRSMKWIEWLELLDALTKNLVESCSKGRGIILTADHGVIDVPARNHIYLDDCADLNDVLDVGGDPRASFIYFPGNTDLVAKQSALSDWIGELGHVLNISELLDSGLYSEAVLKHTEILPDLVVLPKNGTASYDRRFAKPASLHMIGQHGGITEQEIAIPVLRLGDYSSSLLVP